MSMDSVPLLVSLPLVLPPCYEVRYSPGFSEVIIYLRHWVWRFAINFDYFHLISF
jgi:hypothetical protein